MPGDVISAEVYAKYIDPVSSNWTSALNTLLSQIAAGTAPAGTVVDGASYSGSTASFPFPTAAAANTASSSEAGPKAYLNWLVFDRNFNFILSESGYDRISTAPKETGQDVAHELLFSPQITIKQAGYVYIYISNEESSPLEVYFDDFKVTHTKSPVIESQDFYPFGLVFNNYQRENSLINKIKFQGQEHIDDLGLNWDSFKWRNHQPDIGRFFNVDPLAAKYVHNSPYAFSENKVIAHIELEGLESVTINVRSFKQDYDHPDGRKFGSNPYFNDKSATFGMKLDMGKGQLYTKADKNNWVEYKGKDISVTQSKSGFEINGNYKFKTTELNVSKTDKLNFSIKIMPDFENGKLNIDSKISTDSNRKQTETFVSGDSGNTFMTGAAPQNNNGDTGFLNAQPGPNNINSSAQFGVELNSSGDRLSLQTIKLNGYPSQDSKQNAKEFEKKKTVERD